MSDVSYRMSPATTKILPVPPTIERSQIKQVTFSPEVVSTQVPSYDRQAVPSDSFSCDICSVRIPSGIRGFEPYGTCPVCEDGFDVCGACCGTANILEMCGPFVPGATPPTLRVRHHHPHNLQVVDRAAEVRWANGDYAAVATTTTTTTNSGASASGVVKKKRSKSRGRSKTPKKKPKLKMD